MLNKLRNSVKNLKSSKEFKEVLEKYPCYLASCFTMFENVEEANWQIDYYYAKENKMFSFVVNKDVKVSESNKIFQKEKKEIKELNLDKVKIDFEEAIDKVESLIESKYKGEKPNKIIVILQNIENEVWNITYITNSFNLLHVKVNAINGNVEEESFESVLKFRK